MGTKNKPIEIDPEIAARCEGPEQSARFKAALQSMLSETGKADAKLGETAKSEPERQANPKKAKQN